MGSRSHGRNTQPPHSHTGCRDGTRGAKDGRRRTAARWSVSLLSLRQAWFDFDFTQEDNDDKVMQGEKGEQVVPCP